MEFVGFNFEHPNLNHMPFACHWAVPGSMLAQGLQYCLGPIGARLGHRHHYLEIFLRLFE